MYEIGEYVTENGRSPIADWLNGPKAQRAQARILARLDRVQLGDLGDWQALRGATGVAELGEPYGPGCRLYCAIIDQRLVLLLAGSTKRDQRKALEQAERYLQDYHRRNQP